MKTLEVSKGDLEILCKAILEDWVEPENYPHPASCKYCHKDRLYPWPDFEIRTFEHDKDCPVLIAYQLD